MKRVLPHLCGALLVFGVLMIFAWSPPWLWTVQR